MPNAIETHHLTKRFDPPGGWRRLAAPRSITAVNDVNLTVREGELFGLLGPNGAGKTTLVKILATLIAPTAGTATIGGYPLTQSGAIRAQVGLVVTDERSFYWRLTARRNLRFFAAMYGLHGSAAERRIDQVLDEVDLLARAESRFSSFSTGMKQRLAIARGLLHRPKIMFLDEPSRSLDPTATNRLHDLMQRLITELRMTVVLITHNLAEAEKMCDRVAVMHQGQVQAVGESAELRRHLQPLRQYTIAVDHFPPEARIKLHQLAPDAQIEADYIRFNSAETGDTLTTVLDYLRGQAITIHTIDGHPPTLEEVFASLTR